jgi:hypothetical protein
LTDPAGYQSDSFTGKYVTAVQQNKRQAKKRYGNMLAGSAMNAEFCDYQSFSLNDDCTSDHPS